MAPVNQLLEIELTTKSRWSVRLGAHEWTKYTHERSVDDPLQLLGSARRGMQSGSLAKLGDEFVLVVGDHVTHLSHSDYKNRAGVTAHSKIDDRPFVFQPVPLPATPPVVVIKRRRVPSPH
jgi:hypothetical protein